MAYLLSLYLKLVKVFFKSPLSFFMFYLTLTHIVTLKFLFFHFV